MSLRDDAAMGRDEFRTREAQLGTQPRRYTVDVTITLHGTLVIEATSKFKAMELAVPHARDLYRTRNFCIMDIDTQAVGEPE